MNRMRYGTSNVHSGAGVIYVVIMEGRRVGFPRSSATYITFFLMIRKNYNNKYHDPIKAALSLSTILLFPDPSMLNQYNVPPRSAT